MKTLKRDGHQIVCAGIGGRGVLLASTVLVETAMASGYHAISSDEYGMSQRGGSVVSLLKIGDFKSPMIGRENADILLSFEESEFYRDLYFLKRGGKGIINTQKDILPDDVMRLIDSRGIDVYLIDCDGVALKIGAIQASNMVLLGFFSNLSIAPFTYEHIRETIKAKTKGRFLEKNLEAFDMGYKREARPLSLRRH